MKKALLFLMTLLPLFVSAQIKRTIHVAMAGTLPTLISEEEKYEIEELTLSGELNGTDFKLIRDMAGVIEEVKEEFDGDKIRWVEYLSTEGILKSINLAESRIVSGGMPYYLEGDKPITGTAWIEKYYTESDAISSYLFARTKIETIILPNSVTSIGACVFSNCNRLTSITIPYSVTSISGVAFGGSCLTSIQVESGNNKYDSRNNCNAIIDSNNQLIAGCKNTIIPNSVTSIGDYAFYGCSGLASITIPNNVTSIGNGAFSGCSGLTSIIIPNSVTTIGEDAFCGCSGLTSITIPNKVTSISNGAFQGCSGLTSFTIPNSVTSIGGDAFHGCSGLTSITIGNNVTSIGDYAFYGCSGLASITIPNNVTSIGWETFYGCSGLTSITIGKNVTSIRRGAFGGCSALTASIKVENGNQKYDSRNNCNAIIETSSNTMILGCKNTTIPNTVTSIGYNAFYGCSGLTSINIPDNVTSIGSSAFSGCSGLTSVTIGKNVTSIGDYTFYGCSGLKSVTSLNPVPPSIIGTSLGSVYENAALNVPHGSKKAYMNADFWKLFKTINEVGDINGDGTVDSSDIEEIKEYLMGNPSDYFNEDNADVNEDGYVNIADIVAIINIIKNNNDSDKSDHYLTFVAEETGTFEFSGTEGNGYISYSLDSGNTWNTLANNTNSPTVSAGQKIMWKGTLTPVTGGIGRFSSTGRFLVEGNAMSLLYGDNFIGQTSLSGKDYALNMLFRDCTGLTSAENLSLPATTLSYRCYRGMFAGCTGLTTAPSILPALILANNCYESMFYSCTSLTTAPELPATTLAYSCYNYMFLRCTSLTTAPELPATTLANYCYQGMFNGCTSLNYIKCLATDISATNCTYNWVNGVSSSGTFVKNSSMSSWTTGDNGIPSGWAVQESGNYLTFVAQETGTFKFGGIKGNEGISYSLDEGNTWHTLARNTDSPTVSAGNKIMWKGLLIPLYQWEEGIGTFSSTGRFTVEGNAHSLLWGDDFQGHTSLSGKDYAFSYLFSGCTGLTSAENLVLPATTLDEGCYSFMFYGCTSLTTAPELPATTLTSDCYHMMFYNCTSLNYIKCLATGYVGSCGLWTYNVSSTGTFIKNSSMSSWTTGDSGIPSGWTVQNE